jgi:hypothetical protein
MAPASKLSFEHRMMQQQLDEICRRHVLIGFWPALALIVFLGLAGLIVGLSFPKQVAAGLLETPGVTLPSEVRERTPEQERTGELESQVGKTRPVTLHEYRRVMSGYSTAAALQDFLSAANIQGPAAQRLLVQAESPAFWDGVASPVLPFSRRDAREFGDIRDAASNALVGLELSTNARDAATASEMLGIMARYLTNALLRERVRTWVLRHSTDASSKEKALQADIIEARMKIDSMGRRIHDFKEILARYPDSAKLDSRQVISITEGSDRFLSPLAQLVAADTSITQLRESITRKERQARQYAFQERFFQETDRMLQSNLTVADLIPGLAALASKQLEGVDQQADWAQEIALRIQADVAGFSSALASFGIRNEPRVSAASARDPLRLAGLGAAAALLLLGLVAFVSRHDEGTGRRRS